MPSNPIRVAFLSSTLNLAGAENVVRSVVRGLPKDRFEVELYFFRDAGTVGGELLAEGFGGAAHLQDHRADPRVLIRLSTRLRRFDPDILFALDHHNVLFWGGFCAALARVPRRVVASHSTGQVAGRPSFRITDRPFLRSVDAVVALSESHARYLVEREGLDGDRIEVIENGIDVDACRSADPAAVERLRHDLGIGSDQRVVLMLAALRPEKAHEALLGAAMRLRGSRPGLRYLLVGDGPRRAQLEAHVSRTGLTGTVRLLGERRDVPELLALADVLVLPSHAAVETLPLAVLEAMAAGVPVVASRVGSLPDLIEDGVNGRLIGPADAIGLSDAICYIIDKDQERGRIIENAKSTVERKHTVSRMVARFTALFERLAT